MEHQKEQQIMEFMNQGLTRDEAFAQQQQIEEENYQRYLNMKETGTIANLREYLLSEERRELFETIMQYDLQQGFVCFSPSGNFRTILEENGFIVTDFTIRFSNGEQFDYGTIVVFNESKWRKFEMKRREEVTIKHYSKD